MAPKQDWTIETRATLLARLKDIDNHDSWTEFYDIYSPLIFTVAKRRGLSETEAQDAVVETIASVARHMPKFDYDPGRGSFKSWLLQMARWRIFDQFKKRLRPPTDHATEDERLPRSHDSDLDKAKANDEWKRIWDEEWEKCLLAKATERVRRRMNLKQYQAYDLYVNKQWSPERVAKFLSMPVGQVYLAKHRVVETLKTEVARLQNEII